MRVVFIPKAGKPSYDSPKSYHPIMLSNFILKGLVRVVQWFINMYHVKRPLVLQHAYTRGLSTETALSTFTDQVESMLLRGKHALAVSLDCSGAFDSISFDSAKAAMERVGIPQNIVRWYDNILRGRRVSADLQGEQATVCPGKGSPQGGILSPLVWNLIMDTLLSQLEGEAVSAVGYADDVMLYTRGIDLSVMHDQMQQTLNLVSAWGRDKGLFFNPAKTQVVIFTKKRKTKAYPLKLGEVNLKEGKTLTYLGLNFQKTLNWTDYMDDRLKKCRRILAAIRRVIGREWGLDPEKVLWVYKSIIRPKLSYASLVWAMTIQETTRKKMERLQRLALLSIFHPLRSTPTKGLEVCLGVIPLDLFVRREAAMARLQTRPLVKEGWDGLGSRGPSTPCKGHRRYWDDLLRGKVPEGMVVDKIPAILSLKRKDTEVVAPAITIYMDGSKQGKTAEAGFGWVATVGDMAIGEGYGKLAIATVYQAELVGINSALDWLATYKKHPGEVLIRADSQSALLAIKSHLICSRLVLRIVDQLTELRKDRVVEFSWIKGHAEHTGNEYADMLAKAGCDLDRIVGIPVPKSYLKAEVKSLFLEEWQKRWTSEPTCVISRLFCPKVSEGRQSLSKLKRTQLNLLGQVVTGQGLFESHLAHWKDVSEICSLCQEGKGSSWHLWAECDALARERIQVTDSGEESLPAAEILDFFSRTPSLQRQRGRLGDI